MITVTLYGLFYIYRHINLFKVGTQNIQKGQLDTLHSLFNEDEFGGLALEFDQMILSLQTQLKEIKETTVQEEQEKQQAAFSRELHDTLGIVISSMKILLKQMEPILRSDPTHLEKYIQMEQLLNEAYVQVRELSNIPVPEAIIRRGLKTAINSLVNRTELIFPIQIQFITNIQEDQLSAEQIIASYLMIRELLNNAVKHSKCKHIIIQLIQEDGGILIMFEDDGVGISQEDINKLQSTGLKNINQRLQKLGGHYEIDSNNQSGTTFSIEFPLQSSTPKPKPSIHD